MSFFFFFSSRRRHTRSLRDWSSDVCSSDLRAPAGHCLGPQPARPVPAAARLGAAAARRLAAPAVVLADAAPPEVTDRGQPLKQPGAPGLQLGQQRTAHQRLSKSGCYTHNQTTLQAALTPSTYIRVPHPPAPGLMARANAVLISSYQP